MTRLLGRDARSTGWASNPSAIGRMRKPEYYGEPETDLLHMVSAAWPILYYTVILSEMFENVKRLEGEL